MKLFIVASLTVFLSGVPAASGAADPPQTASVSEVEGPWTPVCKHFGKSLVKESVGLARFCLDGKHAKVLIATVPDPELTHLSLTFDRIVESITRAASDGDLGEERYSFDGYWFPWLTGLKDDPDAGKRKTTERERTERVNQPGLLLFRSQKPPEKLLLVFLVGETPTSGVNQFALQAAWEYANYPANDRLPICGGAQCTAILGPTFTGSIPSLNAFLQSQNKRAPTVIISGTVTGALVNPSDSPANIHFCTTTESNQTRVSALFRFLEERTGSNPSRDFAFLTEDETAYGEKGEKGALTLRYPRGISRLRNSFEEIPGAAGKVPQGTPYTPLPLNLRDPGQDSIPSLSAQQTPVSQEAVVGELAATLRHERIRYVGIIATDPLDELFLSRTIRALAPNVRIVLFHSDLLFSRQAREWGLSGILAVTSYSLIARNQYVEGTLEPSRTQFPDEESEGVYNAMRRMFLGQGPDSDPFCNAPVHPGDSRSADFMLDYFDPFASKAEHKGHRPPVWFTMLGRDEWWPVAAVVPDSKIPSLLLYGPHPASHSKYEIFRAESGLRLWSMLYWTILLGAITHSALILLMNTKTFPAQAALWRVTLFRKYAVGYKPALGNERRRLLAAGLLVIATACAALAATQASSGLGGGFAWAALASGIFAAAEAVWLLGRNTPQRLGLAVSLFAASLWPAFVWVRAQADLPGNWLEFSGYRAVHVEGGTSPLLPVLAFLLAIWVCVRLRLGQSRIEEDWHGTFPVIAQIGLGGWRGNPNDPVPPVGIMQTAACLVAIAAWLFFFGPWESLQSIEGTAYAVLVAGLSTLLFGLLALTVAQLLSTWFRLRKLLHALERHPVRYAFSRLPKDFTWTSVWKGDPRPRLLIAAKTIQVLQKTGYPDAGEIYEQLALLSSPGELYRGTHSRVDDINLHFDQASAWIAGGLADTWAKGASDTFSALEKNLPNGAIGEEFLALRFLAWIQYALLKMRALLKFIAYGSIFLVAGLSSYPFEGRRQIDLALIIIFASIGVSVLFVFAELERDPLLSRLSETEAHTLGRGFFIRALSYGALPLATLLTTQVPEIGNFILKWLQPALQAIK